MNLVLGQTAGLCSHLEPPFPALLSCDVKLDGYTAVMYARLAAQIAVQHSAKVNAIQLALQPIFAVAELARMGQRASVCARLQRVHHLGACIG